ncbi:MAG: hypothetical protein ACRDT0_20195, partial [Pseudonocardiaceae bacterium]
TCSPCLSRTSSSCSAPDLRAGPTLAASPAEDQLLAHQSRSHLPLLTGWIAWARRGRLPTFVKLAKTITR